jgi:hypothetical protein
MSYVRIALLATAAIGVMAVAAPASAQVVTTSDGQYYKLVPLRRPLPRTAPEMVTVIPNGATASVPQTSSCRLTSFENHEYQPQYVTECGAE